MSLACNEVGIELEGIGKRGQALQNENGMLPLLLDLDLNCHTQFSMLRQ